MKKKSELGIYLKKQLLFSFSHPLFYLIALIFTLFVNINYFIRQQFFSGKGSADLILFFSVIPYICIIVIPALCYKKNESIYDAFIPLKKSQKILAHFLEVMILYTVLLILLIPSCLIVNLFGQIDFGKIFISLLCLLFYGASTISLCFFINEIISSKIISTIISAILLSIFHTSHLFTVYIPSGKLLSSFFKIISFAWHFDSASKGILDTRDFSFFILTSLLFLLLTAYVMEVKAGKKYQKIEKQKIRQYFLILLLLLLNSFRWYTKIDFSKDKIFSISDYSSQLLSKLQAPLKITYYRSQSLSRLYPQIRDVADFLNEYSSKNKSISYLIKNPDNDESLKSVLENYGITSQQLQNINSNSTEYTNVYSAVVLEYQGNIETIPFTMSAQSLEYDLDGRILHLLTGKERIVNLILGNGMSFYQDYDYLVPWLNSQGFVCNLLYIDDPSFASTLDLCTGPLVVFGDSKINIENAIAIENYILSQKGNAFFAISPYSVDIERDWSLTQNKYTNLVEVLENWGVTFLPEIAADISCSKITLYSQNQDDNSFTQASTYTQVLNYPFWINLLPQENCKGGMTLFWPVSLELSQNAQAYIVSSPYAYSIPTDKNTPERMLETNPFMFEQMDNSDKIKETKILGAKITGPLSGLFNAITCKDSNIIVVSDPYFVNSLMIGYNGGNYGDYRNFDFLTNSLLQLNGESELAQLQEKNKNDTSLYKIKNQQTFYKYTFISYLILFALIPIIILLCGIGIFILNKIKTAKKIDELLLTEDESESEIESEVRSRN